VAQEIVAPSSLASPNPLSGRSQNGRMSRVETDVVQGKGATFFVELPAS